jgi:transcriptional regulator of arginine metabolism
MPTTQERRSTIRRLLAQRPVASQAELLAALESRGINASQPMLSRDLRALKVAKRDGIYQVFEEERVTPLSSLRSLLRAASAASHFLVVGSEPGAASAVARALEAEGLEGIVGTVAGDDTVLVCLDSKTAQRRARQRVEELL